VCDFDSKAETWDDRPDRVERTTVVAKRITKLLDLNIVVNALEYGSGTGLLSFSLKEKLKNITLLDASEGMTKVAQQKCQEQGISNLHPVYGDFIDETGVRDEIPKQFDLIYTMLALHHVPDTEKLLSKFKEVITPDRALVIIDLVKEDGSFHDDEFHGHKGFERKNLEAQLIMSGFNPYYYEICSEIVKDKNGETRKYPIFLMLARA